MNQISFSARDFAEFRVFDTRKTELQKSIKPFFLKK